jgi:hypothetical protein
MYKGAVPTFPHQTYIAYLISKREQNAQSLLADMGLPYPSDDSFAYMIQGMGAFPDCWSRSLLRSNLPLRRWLKKLGVLFLWEDPSSLRQVARIFNYPLARIELEAGLIRGLPYDELKTVVRTFSPVDLTPEVLSCFTCAFWDIQRMGPNDWVTYLRYRPSRDIEEALQQGRELRARELDRKESTDDHEYLSDILRMTRFKMAELSRQSVSASSAQALAMLAKVGMEALMARQDIASAAQAAGADLDYIEHWRSRFEVRKLEAPRPFLTYEDIKKDEENSPLTGVKE